MFQLCIQSFLLGAKLCFQVLLVGFGFEILLYSWAHQSHNGTDGDAGSRIERAVITNDVHDSRRHMHMTTG
jgi:hypothetical protein